MYVFLFSSTTLARRDESQEDGALQILLEYSKQTQNNFPEDHGLRGRGRILCLLIVTLGTTKRSTLNL